MKDMVQIAAEEQNSLIDLHEVVVLTPQYYPFYKSLGTKNEYGSENDEQQMYTD